MNSWFRKLERMVRTHAADINLQLLRSLLFDLQVQTLEIVQFAVKNP